MKRFLSGLPLLLLWSAPAIAAAPVVAAEYFINTDPGPGLGTVIPLAVPTERAAMQIDIPPAVIAALPAGTQTLACRVRDEAGNWSVAFARPFYKEGGLIVNEYPPTVSFAAVTPDPRNRAVESLTLVFSKPVVGLDRSDFRLTRNGGANLLTADQTLSTTDQTTFTLGGLASLTGAEGHYEVTLVATGSGIADAAGSGLANDAVTDWTTDTTAPTAALAAVTPNPRNTAVGSVLITLSEAVTGLDLGDLVLSRNGGGNLLTPAQTVTAESGTRLLLGGLSALTATEGTYSLRLNAAGSNIADAAGNVLVADALAGWRTDTAPPSATITATRDPRNTGVASLRIVFSEAVQGFDLTDLALSRAGGTNLLPGPATLETADRITFTLGGLAGLTSPEGDYALTLRAAGTGIADAAGNALTAGATETWAVDRTDPTASIVAVSPDPRNSSVGSLTLVFSEAITGLTVADLSLTRAHGVNLLSGAETLTTTDNRTFQLGGLGGLTGAEGRYAFLLAADGSNITDAAGNPLASDAEVRWSTDRTAPTVQIAEVTPDPRNSAVSSLQIRFSEPVTGLDTGDLVLRRNGGGNLLDGSATLSTADNLTFTLAGLATVTAAEGAYAFTLNATTAGIADMAGNPLTHGAAETWSADTTAPTVSITAVTPDPRTSAVSSIRIVFSEAIIGFDLADLALSRNDGANLLTGLQTLHTADNQVFTLTGLTSLTVSSGIYRLGLPATGTDIVDLAGNRLTDGVSESWTKGATLTLAAEYFIDADPGPGNGTPVTVSSTDWPLVLAVDIPPATIADLSPGTHTLACRVRDELGNWSVAFARPFHKEDIVVEPPPLVAAIEFQWLLDNVAVSAPVVISAGTPARELTLTPVASVAGLENGRIYQLVVTPIDTRGQRGIASTRVVLVDRMVDPLTLLLSGLRVLPDGSVQWTFSGERGRTYTVQTSTNLTDWIDLNTIQLATDSVQLTDPPGEAPYRFYRTLTP
jgi:hypothetical protein